MILSLIAAFSPYPDLAEALTSPETGPASAYQVEHVEGDLHIIAKVVPQSPLGQRITVITPSLKDWPAELGAALASLDDDATGEIWCDEIDDVIGGDVREVSRAPLEATYRFDPQPGEDSDKQERTFLEQSEGHVTVSRASEQAPWRVAALNITLQKPFKPAIFAKVSELEVAITCAPAPDGRMYEATSSTTVKGRAVGKGFDMHSVTKITGVVPPVKDLPPSADLR